MRKFFGTIYFAAFIFAATLSSNEEAPSQEPEEELLAWEESSPSSYQGTTTGPGPNGGYPGSPKGSYNVQNPPKQIRR